MLNKDIILINFIDLSMEEKRMILSWRNNKLIREWMYNQEEISLEEHLKFIESLKIDDTKLYFLVKKESEYLGVIDFTDIKKNSVHMGLYIKPQLKGYGRLFMEIIIYYSFKILKVKKIIAEVFSRNLKAYILYKEFNFEEFGIKKLRDEEIKCLELIYENS